MRKLQLIYFKMRALAEAPQMLMHYTCIKYEYIMAWEFYGKTWTESKMLLPFKQLPLLIVNDKYQIPQSNSILRYLEKITGLAHENAELAALSDSIIEGAHELFSPLNPTINFAIESDFVEKKENMRPILKSRADDFNKLLSKYPGPFFFEDGPRGCDFAVFHHISLIQILEPNFLADYNKLAEFVEAIENLPGVSEYLKKRPKLTKVGKSPTLVINGKQHPTGLFQT